MLQLRPTFSESWYRVASLKPRLRAGAQVSRQYYRGERWYVVRDPAGNQFHRLSDPAYRFIGLLDGRRTIEEAWDLVGGQLADDAPTQPEVIQILSQLYAANLVETDITPDATVLLRRHKQMQQRKLQGKLMNVLFPRIPIWDPDSFLKRWLPVARVIFSWFGAIVWIAVVAGAVATLLPHWNHGPDSLWGGAGNVIDPSNWLLLFVMFVFIKFIHELGHAFSCRRFGGECHELGIMLLVLVPTPYVDASTAWAFPSRWKRMFVGAAGMIVELFFAALCAFVWVHTSQSVPIWGIPVHQLAYNAMFIASVSTILFNANPLLRYDGYYILSDLLEIPNLRQKSTEYALGLIKRHVFRLKLPQPLPPLGQRFWLLLYAIASSIYRVFIGVMIILIVTYKVPVLGVLMAAGGVITWMGVPMYQVAKYLMLEPELHRKRGRATAFTLAITAAVVVLIGIIKFNVYVDATGVVEPSQKLVLRTRGNGFLLPAEDGTPAIRVKDGQRVHKGDVILVSRNLELEAKIESDRAAVAASEAQLRQAEATDQVEYKKQKEELRVANEMLADDERQMRDLTITAPFDGKIVAPKLDELAGAFLPNGQEIGQLAAMDNLLIRGVIDPRDAQLTQQSKGKLYNEVRLAGALETVLHGNDIKLYPAAVTDLPDAALGQAGGGDIAVDPRDPKGQTARDAQFLVDLNLANPNGTYMAGQRAYVRFTLDKQPLAWRWWQRFQQLLQTEKRSANQNSGGGSSAALGLNNLRAD